jgi:hypothetical protein
MQAPIDQEAEWARQLRASQIEFKKRFDEAMTFSRNASKRKEVYSRWRQEIGDAAARESAKFVEAYLKGLIKYPQWFESLKSG